MLCIYPSANKDGWCSNFEPIHFRIVTFWVFLLQIKFSWDVIKLVPQDILLQRNKKEAAGVGDRVLCNGRPGMIFGKPASGAELHKSAVKAKIGMSRGIFALVLLPWGNGFTYSNIQFFLHCFLLFFLCGKGLGRGNAHVPQEKSHLIHEKSRIVVPKTADHGAVSPVQLFYLLWVCHAVLLWKLSIFGERSSHLLAAQVL